MELKSQEKPQNSREDDEAERKWEQWFNDHGIVPHQIVWLWNGKTWHRSAAAKQYLECWLPYPTMTMSKDNPPTIVSGTTAWGQSYRIDGDMHVY